MNDTLGKRISTARKRMGMTQDQLAEKVGVTPQAVSKWENDQTCPDITTIPKLADIFGITTDMLLGCSEEEVPVREGTVEDEPQESKGIHISTGDCTINIGKGNTGTIGLAIFVLLVGGLLIAGKFLNWDINLGSVLLPCGLLVFGLFGLFTKFSFFNIGCTLCGGYLLLDKLGYLPQKLDRSMIFPILLVIFGISLLVDALRKPKKVKFVPVFHTGDGASRNRYEVGNDSFDFASSFDDAERKVYLSNLVSGTASVHFGSLEVDLSGVQSVAPGCRVELNCSFGELTLRVPRKYRVVTNANTSFASADISGAPDPNPAGEILVEANVNMGEIEIEYI